MVVGITLSVTTISSGLMESFFYEKMMGDDIMKCEKNYEEIQNEKKRKT